ncbi:MAG TPA: methyltransferase domain-containing protein [Gallionella sp.]|nr:methyltransferase domain-containing protein [Gallionella sp.]
MIKLMRALGPILQKRRVKEANVLESHGHCSTCNQEVAFIAKNSWLRDHFICTKCGSIPRERALMQVVEQFYPAWRDLAIHETSPGNRGASVRLARECAAYMPSQFFPDRQPGTAYGGMRCENLEALTLADESLDLHISQDVMEHIFHPAQAFREIARTLKPGGAHIFTVPLVNKMQASRQRARKAGDGSVEHLEQPVYHGNPIDSQGSLVTMDWGYDIVRHIFEATGLFTHTVHIDDIGKGIRAEYIEVLVTVKPANIGAIGHV